jgi:hypothetical protein
LTATWIDLADCEFKGARSGSRNKQRLLFDYNAVAANENQGLDGCNSGMPASRKNRPAETINLLNGIIPM